MLTPLVTNRASTFTPPADDWYHLVPRGTYPLPFDHSAPTHSAPTGNSAPAAPPCQVLDDKALESICNNFEQDAARPNFAGVLIDFDHFSYDPHKPSEAAGWLQELQNRADGLWGRIKWSDKGEDAIRHGRYRFVSPTWLLRDMEPVRSSDPGRTGIALRSLGEGGPNAKDAHLGPGERGPNAKHASLDLAEGGLRPLRLDSLALTNSPNLRGMAPLSNRGRDADTPVGAAARIENLHGGLIPGAPSVANPTETRMKTVATQLGLSPDASEEAIHSEVAKLLQSVTPLRNRVAEIEASHAGLLAAQVESDLDHHKDKFPAAQRDVWKKNLLANRSAALEPLAGLSEPPKPEIENRKPALPVIHHRETAANPGQRTSDPENSRHQAFAVANRAHELRRADKKLTYDQSFKMAQNELAS